MDRLIFPNLLQVVHFEAKSPVFPPSHLHVIVHFGSVGGYGESHVYSYAGLVQTNSVGGFIPYVTL